MTDLDRVIAEHEIVKAHIRYARALDRRDWPALDQVFAAEIRADYNRGEFLVEGRPALVGMIRDHLGGCGPSQHLVGNTIVEVDGESAESRCYVDVIHWGLGSQARVTYETWADYQAHWKRSAEGWRATRWTMHVINEAGDRSVLQPG